MFGEWVKKDEEKSRKEEKMKKRTAEKRQN
jgi:hypothetical protein